MKKKLVLFLSFIFLFSIYKISLVFSNGAWEGKSRFNIIFFSNKENVFFLSLNPLDKEIVILSFPSATIFKAARGRGFHSAGSFYELKESERLNSDFIIDSFRENLLVPIDGYLLAEKDFINGEEVKPNLFSFFQARETNLNKLDIFKIWLFIKKASRSNIIDIDLRKNLVVEEADSSEEKKSFKINEEKLKELIYNYLKDYKFRQENLTISVLNATSHSGLARNVVGLIEGIGGRVIEIGNASDKEIELSSFDSLKEKKCEIRVKKEKRNFYSVKKLAKVFDCLWGGEERGLARGEIVLILNENYWKNINEK